MKKLLKIVIGLGLILGVFSVLKIADAAVCLVQNGCTGTGQIPTVGQTLIGNASGTYTPGTIAGGSSTIITGVSPIVVNQTGINATTSCPTCAIGSIGPSTSTFLAVFNASGSVVGYVNLTFNSSTGQFIAPTGTFTGNLDVGGNFTVNSINTHSGQILTIGAGNQTILTVRQSSGDILVANGYNVDLLSGATLQVVSLGSCSGSSAIQTNVSGVFQCGSITFPASITSINTATSSAQTIIGGTNINVSTAPGSGNSTTTVSITGVIGSANGGTATTTALGTCAFLNTCGSGGGGGVTTTTVLLSGNVPVGTGAGSIGQSTSAVNAQIPNLNTVLNVPADFATNGCNGSSTLTDFGACVNALYASQSSTGNIYVGIYVPNITVTQAQWKTPINFNIFNLAPSFDCPTGASLSYGGTGKAITFNAVNSYGHLMTQDYGCTLYGSSTPIYGGVANNATTTGIYLGGGNGAVGIDIHDWSVNGFGTNLETSNNTYLDRFENDSLSGWNGGVGYAVKIDPSSNSGESIQFDNVSVTDGGNSTGTKGIFISDNATADLKWVGGSIDDAQFYIGIANPVTIQNVHFENADSAQYPGYAYVYATSSSASILNLQGNVFDQDATLASGTPPEFVEEAVGQLTAVGNYFDLYGTQVVNIAIDHSIGASIPAETLVSNYGQNGAFNYLVNQLPIAVSNLGGVFQEQGNSYPVGIQTDGTNVGKIYNGNQVVGTFDASGNYKLLGNLNATGTISQGGQAVAISNGNGVNGQCAQFTGANAITATGSACGSGGGGSGGLATTTPFSAGYVPVASSSNAVTNSPIYVTSSTGNVQIGSSTDGGGPLNVYIPGTSASANFIYSGTAQFGGAGFTLKTPDGGIYIANQIFNASGTIDGLTINQVSATGTYLRTIEAYNNSTMIFSLYGGGNDMIDITSSTVTVNGKTITTSLQVTNTTSSLLKTDASGNVSAYGGSACNAGYVATGESATGTLTCVPASSTAVFYVDGNRTDSYTPNGSYLYPFKTMSSAIASSTGFSGYAYILSPATYVDGAPDTFPNTPFTILGNQSTWVPASGVTMPNSFDIYDLTIAGNVTESDTSTAAIHQFNNGVITGNLTCNGLCINVGETFPTVTSTINIAKGSIANFISDLIESNFINAGTLNIDDDEVISNATNTTGWAIYSSSTGSNVNVNGMTFLGLSTGTQAIYVNNGATSTPNNLNAFSITVNTSTAGSTITAGSAATIVTNVTGLTNQGGTFIAPSGTAFSTSYDEAKTILGNTTTTSLTVTGVTNALHVGGSGGAVTAYGGSSCTNQGVSAISATGTVTCTTFATSTNPGTVTTSSAGTANFYSKWTSASALGNSVTSDVGTSTFINNSSTYVGTAATSGPFQFIASSTSNKSYINVGSSTNNSVGTLGGALAWSATSTGNSGTASTSLENFVVPTSSFLAAGDEFDFYSGGLIANTAGSKRIQLAIGSTTIFDTNNGSALIPINVAANWFAESRCVANTTSVLLCTTQFTDSASSVTTDDSGDAGNATTSISFTSSTNINVFGIGGASNDLTANYFRVMWNPF